MATEIERQLLDTLKHGDINKKSLNELVKVAGQIHGKGIKTEKVFPIGIVRPDGVLVETSVSAGNLGKLVDILKEFPRVQGVEIFPRGIPAPDVFLAKIQLR